MPFCLLNRDRELLCTEYRRVAAGWIFDYEPEDVRYHFEPLAIDGGRCFFTDDLVQCLDRRETPGGERDPEWSAGPPNITQMSTMYVGFLDERAHCGTDHEGVTWCWGHNTHGGVDPVARMEGERGWLEPRRLEVPPASFVSSAVCSACALTRTGEVWCWGFDDSVHEFRGPTRITLPPMRTIDASDLSGGGGVAVDGRAFEWEGFETEPVVLEGLPADTDRVHVQSDGSRCATTRGGEVWCWGARPIAGPMRHVPNPLRRVIRLPPPIQFRVISGQACVLSERNGEVWCWGAWYTSFGEHHEALEPELMVRIPD